MTNVERLLAIQECYKQIQHCNQQINNNKEIILRTEFDLNQLINDCPHEWKQEVYSDEYGRFIDFKKCVICGKEQY